MKPFRSMSGENTASTSSLAEQRKSQACCGVGRESRRPPPARATRRAPGRSSDEVLASDPASMEATTAMPPSGDAVSTRPSGVEGNGFVQRQRQSSLSGRSASTSPCGATRGSAAGTACGAETPQTSPRGARRGRRVIPPVFLRSARRRRLAGATSPDVLARGAPSTASRKNSTSTSPCHRKKNPPVPLIVLPKSCSCRWGPCPRPIPRLS